MNTTSKRLAVLVLLFVATMASAAETVKITFKVKVPAGTPADDKLYLAGDAEALGAWKAAGVEMGKNDDGTYSAALDLPKDKPIEYKITRGSWETVEKKADGTELDNRTLTPTRDAAVDVEVAAWADKPIAGATPKINRRSTRSGDVRVHENFHSKNLGNNRDLFVFVPPGYDTNKQQRFSVLYMHDGQNLFDNATAPMGEWGADEIALRLILTKKIEPIIIVGISNTPARIDEYTLARDEHRKMGGKGEAYIKFVTEEVKPFIDQTYRTKMGRENTATGGSSLGATIALELCRARPDMFGKCAVISPALWWAQGDLLKRLEADSAWAKNCRVWIDIGDAEAPPKETEMLIKSVNMLADILRNAGAALGKDYTLEIVRGAQHNEQAWNKRFDRILMFLFPPV